VLQVAKPSSPGPDSDDSAVGSTSSPGARDQPSLAAEPAAADAVTSITAGDVPADGSPPLAGAAGGSVPATPSASGGGGAGGGGGGGSGGVLLGGAAGWGVGWREGDTKWEWRGPGCQHGVSNVAGGVTWQPQPLQGACQCGHAHDGDAGDPGRDDAHPLHVGHQVGVGGVVHHHELGLVHRACHPHEVGEGVGEGCC